MEEHLNKAVQIQKEIEALTEKIYVELEKVKELSRKTEEIPPEIPAEEKKEDKEKASYQVISGEEPLSFSFSPESAGLYLLEARGEDSRGNKILTGSSFYVSGKGYGFWEKRKDN